MFVYRGQSLLILLDRKVHNIMRRLILMRGLPGSGKSSYAKGLCTQLTEDGLAVEIVSTDDFWYINGAKAYNFKVELLGIAHAWAQSRCAEYMQESVDVIIVDNTNITFDEMVPYMRLACSFNYAIQVQEPDTVWRRNPIDCALKTVHNVPVEKIEEMAKKWQHVHFIA
jgi:tRNA uridine 5-carbamoylmethylation protein Kti12